MLSSLSTAAIVEKNKLASDSAWLVLLEITLPEESDTLRLVCNNENIEWGGHTWVAFPFMIDSVKQSKDELVEVPVKISNVTRVIEKYVEEYAGFVGKEVVLRIVNSKHLDNIVPEVEENFMVQSATTDCTWCTFKLGGSLPLMLRFPFRRILKDFCDYKYGDIECGCVNANFTTCNRTLAACKARGNNKRFGGEPAMVIGGMYASNS